MPEIFESSVNVYNFITERMLPMRNTQEQQTSPETTFIQSLEPYL